LWGSSLYSQCPDLSTGISVNGSTTENMFSICGSGDAVFDVTDPDIPGGTIDWHMSTTPGFTPSAVNFVGSSTVTSSLTPCSTCPEIEAIYIDVCDNATVSEADNEFAIVSSGSGFAVDDFSFTFNFAGAGGDGNIGPGGTCSWTDGDASLVSGCAGVNVISVGPGDYVPANSIVVIQTSVTAVQVYDFTDVCSVTDCVYVLKNACDRNAAAFKNCDAGGGSRTFGVGVACGCATGLTYQIDEICGFGEGVHVLQDGTIANNGCNVGPTIPAPPIASHNSVIDQFTQTFDDTHCNTTQYIIGVINSPEFNEDCCDASGGMTQEYQFDIVCSTLTLTQDEDGQLCPGECDTYTVEIIGGTPLYDLDVTMTGAGVPISGPLSSFPLGQKITICYDTGGPLIDPGSFTFNIPDIPFLDAFTATMEITGYTDATGCSGTIIDGDVTISFNDAVDAVTPPTQEACNLGNGAGLFTLSDMDNIINGGSGDPVIYYLDAAGTIPILDSPFETGSVTIYGQVNASPCPSELVPIDLNVILEGDAGVVELFCDEDGVLLDECTICDDDGTAGEMVTLTIIFQDPSETYDYEVVWTAASGPSSTIVGTGTGGQESFTFNVFETTTFQITEVTASGGCPDESNLGNIVTVYYGLEPQINDPGTLQSCGSVTLPAIVGDVVANAAYYTMPNGMGDSYSGAGGEVLTTSQTIYIYAGIENCDTEIPVEIIIDDQAEIDDIPDVVQCGQYVLPEITGTNADNATYFTETLGGGNMVPEGQVVTSSITLFMYDPVCGGDEEMINITISPGPVFANPNDTTVCDTFIIGAIIGTNLTGVESYYGQAGGQGAQIQIGDTITSDSIIYIYDNTPGCIVEGQIAVNVRGPLFAGNDSIITFCDGEATTLNFMDVLGDPDTLGQFTETSTSIIVDSTNVDLTTLGIGQYIFNYITEDTLCVNEQSSITINIVGSIDAGIDTTFALCSDTTGVDVLALIGNPDQSGIFYDEAGNVATFDPTSADFTLGSPSVEVFRYVIGEEGSSCGADTSFFTLVSGVDIEAGNDNSITVCQGEQVLLNTLLVNNSEIGMYSEPTVSGGLEVTGIFNSNNVPDGTYTIYHTLTGFGPCPSDTATLTVIVIDEPNAGDDRADLVCSEGTYDLSDLVDPQADLGGDFYQNSTLLSSSIVNIPAGTFDQEYLYILGGGSCPLDTAILTITKPTGVTYDYGISSNFVCEDDCVTVSIDHLDNTQSYRYRYQITDDLGNSHIDSLDINPGDPTAQLEYCVGTGTLAEFDVMSGRTYNVIIIEVQILGVGCVVDINELVQFAVGANSTSTLDDTYCAGQDVPVGSDIYNESNPSGITTIPNAIGCDSVITVELTFDSQVTGNANEEFCEGGSVQVLGVTYDSNFVGDSLLVGGSISGCDSLVLINVSVLENETRLEDEVICSGDTLVIEGEEFFEGNLSDVIVVPGGGSNGCDLIVTVDLGLDASSMFILDDAVCPSYEVMINGTLYDSSNASGTEVIENGSVNGCDSTVIIALDYSLSQIVVDSIVSTCDDGFFIVIDGQVFNRTMPNGMIEKAAVDGGCDTIFNVDITYGELLVEYEQFDADCIVRDSGVVVINEITGVPPFSLIYNGNNTLAFVLPVDIPLPAGQGTIDVMDDSGCMNTISYDIMESQEEDDFSVILDGDSLRVVGGIADSVLWSPAVGLSCTNCNTTEALPEQTTTYIASIFYDDLCSFELAYTIEVDDMIEDYVLPSIFSPNRNGMNDNFVLTITDGAIGVPISMQIYDRWGNLVHQNLVPADIVTTGWDGTWNGQDVRPGVYVYRITLSEGEKIVNLLGDLTVVR